jgi:glycosyltransferase involved in cell wall biosynthesis
MCLSIALEGYAAYRRMQLRERTMRSLAHGIDLWISPSKFLQEFMVAWGLPPEKVTFLPNGISGKSFGQVREPRRNGHLRFAFIGGLTRQKGIHVLLEAFKGMRGASLVIYGLGNIHSYDDFKHVAAQGNVTYEGIMTEKEKPRILRMIDGLIVPSIWYENAPLVIQEAFIAGVPVICSNIGGMKEFVRDGQDGLHFKVGNSGDLRKALEKCIQNPSYLRGMNPLPRNFLSVEEHVSRLIPLYRRCVESKGHGKCLE